jgi:methionyl-tRNA formyltransferase
VATGDGVLSLKQVQLAGKNVVSIKDFNNAYQLESLSH